MELMIWCVVEDWISIHVQQVPEKFARVGEILAVYPNKSFADYAGGIYGEEPMRVLAVCPTAVNRREAEQVLNSMLFN